MRPLGLLEVFSRTWRRTSHTSINFLSITRGLKLRLEKATVDDAAAEDAELKQRGIFWHFDETLHCEMQLQVLLVINTPTMARRMRNSINQ
jgi:hypothetical protein